MSVRSSIRKFLAIALTFLLTAAAIFLPARLSALLMLAAGGLLGSQLFSAVKAMFDNPNTVGSVQAVCLAIVTAGTLAYTLNKERIRTLRVENKVACVAIGLFLGCMSSFLGIGGGPFNVAGLYYFFSMPAKKAAQNSLFIVLFSQLTSTLRTVLFDSVPPFPWAILLGMVLLSIAGSEAGRRINKTIDNRQATLWLEGAMVLVMGISIYNIIKFLG